MKVTHVFYDDPALSRVFLQNVLKVLGPSAAQPLNDYTEDLGDDSNVVLLLSLKKQTLDFHPIPFLKELKNMFQSGKTAILFVGSAFSMSHDFLKKVATFSWDSLVFADYVDADDYSHPEDMAQKLLHLKRSLLDNQNMPIDSLESNLIKLIQAHNTCTLCTGYGANVRATPIEYTYWNSAFYFLSEGGEKFVNLSVNSAASIAIYREYSGFDKLEGIQISGTVSNIPIYSEEYDEILTVRKLSPENIKKLPIKLHMLKLLPSRYEVLSSSFKQEGYDAKQVELLS